MKDRSSYLFRDVSSAALAMQVGCSSQWNRVFKALFDSSAVQPGKRRAMDYNKACPPHSGTWSAQQIFLKKLKQSG